MNKPRMAGVRIDGDTDRSVPEVVWCLPLRCVLAMAARNERVIICYDDHLLPDHAVEPTDLLPLGPMIVPAAVSSVATTTRAPVWVRNSSRAVPG